MIPICINRTNLCFLAKIHSYLPKQSIQLLQYKKFPGMPSTVLSKKTLRSSRPFFKDLSFLIYLTTRSSSLNPFSLLTKYWRLNYWVNMKTVHKSFHLRLFAIFSSIDVNRPSRFSLLHSVKPFHVQKWPKLIIISKLNFAKCWKTVPGNCMKVFSYMLHFKWSHRRILSTRPSISLQTEQA